jgi:release factor glutamine methyltransferase
MTAAWLQQAAQRLQQAGIEDAPREAQLLLRDARDEKHAEAWLLRREKREPLARLKGTRGFWKAEFFLNEATLEPRPDSETLIEAALEFFKDKSPPRRILDIGTGSGCLLLSLLQEFRGAEGVGTDKASRAQEAARRNARTLGLENEASFLCTNWADGVTGVFDLIISNPPYIASAAIVGLQPEVRGFDPLLALDGGVDGLEAYRAIVPQAARLLKPEGVLICEIGFDQAESVTALFRAHFSHVEVKNDLGKNPRAVIGWR